MYLDLNTDQLQNAVQAARSANEAITEAAALLNTVVIHNDWQCPERSEINENTNRNRTQALTLQTDAERLSTNINYAAEAFLAAEQEIINSFNSVDAPIASFLTVTPASLDSVVGSAGNTLAQDAFAAHGYTGSLNQQTDVVAFSTIADLLKG